MRDNRKPKEMRKNNIASRQMMPFEVILIYYSIQTTDFPLARLRTTDSPNYIVTVNSANWCDFFMRFKSHHSSMINASLISHFGEIWNAASISIAMRMQSHTQHTLSCGILFVVAPSVQLNIYKSFWWGCSRSCSIQQRHSLCAHDLCVYCVCTQ